MNDVLSTILEVVITIVVPVVATLGTYAIKQAADWLKLKQDSLVRTYLNDALDRGLDWAIAQLHARLPATGSYGGPALQELVTLVANYAVSKVPDALARLGVTDVGLREIVAARIAAQPVAQAVLAAAKDAGPTPNLQQILTSPFSMIAATTDTPQPVAQPAG